MLNNKPYISSLKPFKKRVKFCADRKCKKLKLSGGKVQVQFGVSCKRAGGKFERTPFYRNGNGGRRDF
jgi:hypothetical protein